MDERDVYLLCGCIALLCLGAMLQLRMIRQMSDELQRADEDLTFLKFAVRTLEGKISDE